MSWSTRWLSRCWSTFRYAQPLLELVEAADAERRVADDEHAPPLAHHLEALGDGAVHPAEARTTHGCQCSELHDATQARDLRLEPMSTPGVPLRTPLLASRLQGLGTTIFAEMSALAARTGAINLGQGFPDTDGPRRVLDAAVAAIRAGRQPVPARAGHPRAARRDRRAPAAVLGPRVRPRQRGPRHRRGHRGDRGRRARAVRAGRRGRRLRAVLRLVRRRIALAGAPAARGARCGPPDVRRFDPDELRAAFSPPHQGWCCSTPRTTRPARCSRRDELALIARLCVEHDLIAVTDEVYEHLVFDGEHRAARDASRDGGAHADDLVGRQDLLVSPAGRSAGSCGPAPLVARGAHGQAVPHLRQRRAVPAGGGRRPRPAATRTSTSFASTLRAQARPALRRAGRRRLRRVRAAGTYFVTADIRPLGGDGRGGVLPGAARALRRGRRADARSSTTTRRRASTCPVRLLQARRGAPRRRPPPRHTLSSPRRAGASARTTIGCGYPRRMRAHVEFTVEPFVEGTPGLHVTAAVDAVRRSRLEPVMEPFGTTVEGLSR